jgi:hypothetical protein
MRLWYGGTTSPHSYVRRNPATTLRHRGWHGLSKGVKWRRDPIATPEKVNILRHEGIWRRFSDGYSNGITGWNERSPWRWRNDREGMAPRGRHQRPWAGIAGGSCGGQSYDTLRPDFIISHPNHHRFAPRALEQLEIPVPLLGHQSVEEVLANVALLGMATGPAQQAETLLGTLRERIRLLTEERVGSRPRVLLLSRWSV